MKLLVLASPAIRQRRRATGFGHIYHNITQQF